jgi:zinc transporter ZupT
MRPDNASAGLAIAAVSLFARLILATAALWAYKFFAPSGFKPFALCLAGGFLVLYTFEVVRYAGLHKLRRPAATRQ